MSEGDLLWSPTPEEIGNSRLTDFRDFVTERIGRGFSTYEELWEFSTSEIELFWNLIWDFFQIKGYRPSDLEGGFSDLSPRQRELVLSSREMPGAEWFRGAKCNYAKNALAGNDDDVVAVGYSETRPVLKSYTRADLRGEVVRIQGALRNLGVVRGDRVAAYAPNIFETLAFFLASASLGAVWSSCSPDFGSSSVIDRLIQIEPKVLFVVDGYRYGGKDISRLGEMSAIEEAIPSLCKTVVLEYLGVLRDSPRTQKQQDYHEFLSTGSIDGPAYFEEVDFSHPLWILYSSGTTGLPKPIVQSHGGIVIEHLKALGLHLDLGPQDRFFWFTTTGWMMWNFLISGLLIGCTVILYDGSPLYPDLGALWKLAESTGMTYFGTSASFIQSCQKSGIKPGEGYDLSSLRSIGSTGSPLSPEGFVWVYENVSSAIRLASASGGTDTCTPFLASSPWHSVRAGEISARCLGCDVAAFDDNGNRVVDQVGELVIANPMPSMPVGFWNDPDGTRYRDAYFSYFPGKWRHGDWVLFKPTGASVIYGRSDSTLNRGGVRMGTADFYRIVESFDEISDSLVVDTSYLAREGKLMTFVVMAPGFDLTLELKDKIGGEIRRHLSPRHVPDQIVAVTEIPRTLNGKKMEIPVKRILLGEDPERVAAKGAVFNPEALESFVEIAAGISGRGGG